MQLFVEHEDIHFFHNRENCRQGGRNIQVVIHGAGETVFKIVEYLFQFRVRPALFDTAQIINTAIQPLERTPGVVQPLFRKRNRFEFSLQSSHA